MKDNLQPRPHVPIIEPIKLMLTCDIQDGQTTEPKATLEIIIDERQFTAIHGLLDGRLVRLRIKNARTIPNVEIPPHMALPLTDNAPTVKSLPRPAIILPHRPAPARPIWSALECCTCCQGFTLLSSTIPDDVAFHECPHCQSRLAIFKDETGRIQLDRRKRDEGDTLDMTGGKTQ